MLDQPSAAVGLDRAAVRARAQADHVNTAPPAPGRTVVQKRRAGTVAAGRQPAMSWAAMRLAVSAGMAKPTPMLPDCWPI
jgi:hypothetical protein